MRILVVAMANSIHTTRWLEQFDHDDDLEIYLFPSTLGSIKKDLSKWKRMPGPFIRFTKHKRVAAVHIPVSKFNTALHFLLEYIFKVKWRDRWLEKTIKRIKPDIIHSMEFQQAGYTCLRVQQKMGDKFPTWIATNWGSDVYLFSQIKAHREPIKGILQRADFYSAECDRDYKLAGGLGMMATPLPIIPNSGGIHLEEILPLRNRIPTSQRKLILIKGYQMFFGRALSALRAVELMADELKEKGYSICFFSVTVDIELAIELVANRTGLEIQAITLKHYMSHKEILDLHAQARCYIGMSISDGISTSMLEAMALGAFPIQTCTSCANEWIEDGLSGFIAPNNNDEAVYEMLRKAINDDALVDKAAEINWNTLQEKASYDHVRKIARGFYDTAYAYKRANP